MSYQNLTMMSATIPQYGKDEKKDEEKKDEPKILDFNDLISQNIGR